MKDHKQAISTKDRQDMTSVIPKPKSLHQTIPATAKMIAGIMQGLKQLIGAESFIRQQIQQHLTTPAEQDTIDGTAIF